MTKNTSRTFATMSEEERRNFALEADAGSGELPAQLDFDEPRDRAATERGTRRKRTEEPE